MQRFLRKRPTAALNKFFYSLNKSQNIGVGVQAVKQSVWDAVFPIDRNRNKSGVDILPTFDGKEYRRKLPRNDKR